MDKGFQEREWRETIAPQYLHNQFGVYHGQWMPQMDRCWMSNDGLQVTSRLLITPWGKVEHAAISIIRHDEFWLSSSGERDIPWRVKQEIKNELFGENRLAIEVFPKEKNLVDAMDIYHLWVFPKDFELPFGIHPTRDKQAKTVKRGVPQDPTQLAENFKWAQQFIVPGQEDNHAV